MSIEIQAGKRYVMRYGGITAPMRHADGGPYFWSDGSGSTWRTDGRYAEGCDNHRRDFIAEYTQPEPLGFELKAGEKYETVKPDGTAGPVVTTYERTSNDQFSGYLNIGVKSEHAVLPCGLIIAKFVNTYSYHGYRIVRPYIEPEPPTPIERLELVSQSLNKLKHELCNEQKFDFTQPVELRRLETETRSIIADLKAAVKP